MSVVKQQPHARHFDYTSKSVDKRKPRNYLNRAIAIAGSVNLNTTIIDTTRLESGEQVLDGSNAVAITRERGA